MSDSLLSPLFTWRGAIVDSDLRPTVRHVALTLSLHMNERGGSCFPSMATLARETGLDVSTVRRSLLELAQNGWMVREISHGRGRSNRYTATLPENRAQDAVSEAENRAAVSIKPRAVRPKDVSLKGRTTNTPPDTPSEYHPPTQIDLVETTQEGPRMVARRRVTPMERADARTILECFNGYANSRFTPAGWFERIIRRMREFPDLSVADHCALIERAFSKPWWSQGASPAVIYGNRAIFETTMQARGGVTEADLDAMRDADLDAIRRRVG